MGEVLEGVGCFARVSASAARPSHKNTLPPVLNDQIDRRLKAAAALAATQIWQKALLVLRQMVIVALLPDWASGSVNICNINLHGPQCPSYGIYIKYRDFSCAPLQ